MALSQALGQTPTLPLQIDQKATLYNYQSYSGVPLSTIVGDPAGSDGRTPTIITQGAAGLTVLPPTDNQFSGFLSWGAVAYPTTPGTVASPNIKQISGATTYAGNAENIGLPHGGSGASRVVMLRAMVGAPFLNRPVSFLFGGIIPQPEENEDGNEFPPSVSPTTYWLVEPHLSDSDTTHLAKGYYFSPHARVVFAIQPGPIKIIWRKII